MVERGFSTLEVLVSILTLLPCPEEPSFAEEETIVTQFGSFEDAWTGNSQLGWLEKAKTSARRAFTCAVPRAWTTGGGKLLCQYGEDTILQGAVRFPGLAFQRMSGLPPPAKGYIWTLGQQAHRGKGSLLQVKIKGGWVTEIVSLGPCYLLCLFSKTSTATFTLLRKKMRVFTVGVWLWSCFSVVVLRHHDQGNL